MSNNLAVITNLPRPPHRLLAPRRLVPSDCRPDGQFRPATMRASCWEEPWFFNVGRQRVLDLPKPELQAFFPTGAGWHVPEKFAKLQIE